VATILDDYDIEPEMMDLAKETLEVIYLRSANPMFRGISISFVREAGFAKLYSRLDAGDKTLVFKHGYRKMKQLRAIVAKAWDKKFEEVKKAIKKATDWDKPENRPFRQWALTVKAMAAKAGA
jgi:hypothetical protein